MTAAETELAEIRRMAAEAWRLAQGWEAERLGCPDCGRNMSEASDAADDALYRRILGPHFDYDGDPIVATVAGLPDACSDF